MNYRYDINHINGLKVIEYYTINDTQPGEALVLNINQSISVLKSKTRHEENALFYQLVETIYQKESNYSELDKDRKLYRENNRETIDKFYTLLTDKLVYVDFNSIFNINNPMKMNAYDDIAERIFIYGFFITKSDGRKIKYLPFQKSGSMSRSFTISFIDEKYKEDLEKRLDFGLFIDDEKYNISKVLAYKGLYLSNGIRIELDSLDENSVIIVNDYNKKDTTSSFTTVINRNTVKDSILEMFFATELSDFYDKYNELYNLSKNSINATNNKNDNNLETANDIDFKIQEIYKHCQDFLKRNSKFDYKTEKIPEILNKMIREVITYYYNILGLDKMEHDEEYILVEGVNAVIQTNMFDGQGFIDKDFIETINRTHLNVTNDDYHYSAQFRLPFTKGMLHAVNLGEWFKFVKKSFIVDAFGIKREIKTIKMIITKSQFKCYKWLNLLRHNNKIDMTKYKDPMKYYFHQFKKYNHALYFTNLDTPSKKSSDTVLNYQVLHTPALNYRDFNKILKKGNEEYLKIRTDKDSQIEYFLKSLPYNDSIGDLSLINTKKEHLLLGEILKRNSNYIYDPLYQNRLERVSESLIKNMKLGRISIEGSVNYLVGDLLENLHYITFGTGIYYANDTGSEFYQNLNRAIFGGDILLPNDTLKSHFYLPNIHDNFPKEKTYSILRNPHITSKELIIAKPVPDEKNLNRKRFFGHLNNVLMINAFTNNMMAMQTADTDGDTVRIICNDIYNKAVEKAISYNKNQIILFPDIKSESKQLSKENIYQTVKKTFSSRVGIISNHAFSHSILAYNENNTSNPKEKEIHRLEAEKLSCIVAAEIDAAKSGKAPYYIPDKINEPYLKYIKQVKANKKENVNFKLTQESPNLHYLKDNAKDLIKQVRKVKITNPISQKFQRFTFEDNTNWKTKLNKKLQGDLALLITAYIEWNRHVGYLWKQNNNKQNTIISTILFILDLQYDNGANEMLVENIINKFITLDKSLLAEARNMLIDTNWHYSLKEERDQLIDLVFLDFFSQEEKDILSNFNQEGHKLFFLALTEAISRIEKEKLEELSVYNSISRYESLIKYELNAHNLNSSKILKNISNDILNSDIETQELMKKYIDGTTLSGKYEYSKVEKYINLLNKQINDYKKKNKNITTSDLKTIGNHFLSMSKHLFDEGNNLVASSISRSAVYDYCHNEISNMFIKHKESREELVKYVYSLKKYDSSSKFLVSICHNQFLDNIKDYRQEDEDNA